MSEKKKPFYKKWWVLAIAGVLVLGVFATIVQDDDEPVTKESSSNANETDNDESIDNDSNNNEDEELKIEVNKEFEFEYGGLKLGIQTVKVVDNKLSFGFWWNHWAGNEDVHFSYFAYPIVEQNGESLEYEDKNDSLLRQRPKGVDGRVDLEYKLIDDSPVTIKFKTTSDNPEEESFEVELN